MLNYLQNILALIKRLLLLLAIFEISRFVFFVFNLKYFSEITLSDFLISNIAGLRFDFTAIVYCFSPLLLWMTIPGRWQYSNLNQKLLRIAFTFFAAITILPSIIDTKYFHFINKRSTADLLSMVLLGDDLSNLFFQYLFDFWYLISIWLLLVFFSWRFFPKPKIKYHNQELKTRNIFLQSIISILILSLLYTGARGIELKPIRIITAAKYVDNKHIPLVLNTTFAIVTTFGKPDLPNYSFYPDNEIEQIFPIQHKYNSKDSLKNKNVVILIIESLSKEYIGELSGNKTYTPFIDSLIRESLVFPNTYANGKKSIDALPAVLSSLPGLSRQPFITSQFASNKIESINSLLKRKNYHSSFFHGGSNGTMGFNYFTDLVGTDDYFGADDYPNQADHDGNWGIFDEPFLQYFAEKLNTFKKPFISTLFSLSSHHPYPIPEKYKGKFPSGEIDILPTIGYADQSLRSFFNYAKQFSWFKNTLFIITADHTEQAISKYYRNRIGKYSIPLIFYDPQQNIKGKENFVCQQLDIMPSILDYLNFNQDFAAFGNSVFDTTATNRFSISYEDGSYQLIKDSFRIAFDVEKVFALNNIYTDSLLMKDLRNKNPELCSELHNFGKAIIQQYNNNLSNNSFFSE